MNQMAILGKSEGVMLKLVDMLFDDRAAADYKNSGMKQAIMQLSKKIELLDKKRHDRTKFDCGNQELNNQIKKYLDQIQ